METARFYIVGQLEILRRNMVGINLLDDLKIIHRIPQGQDMALFTKYQVQLDTDLSRLMKMLQDHRDNKSKVIEGEIIEDIEA